MKKSNFLLLAAASLLSMQLYAAENGKGMVRPVFSPLAKNTDVYLYNIKADKFLCAGNDWNTRASLSDKPLKLQILEPENGVFEMQNEKGKVFTANDAAAWVDNANEANRYFKITQNDGSNTYRITQSEKNTGTKPVAGSYFAWDNQDAANGLIDPQLSEADFPGGGFDWAFVTPADYNTYMAATDMTSKITTPNFDGNSTGWTGDTPGFNYSTAEFYNKNYSISQTVTGLPTGVYALDVQAFYRAGNNNVNVTNFNNGTEKNAYLYANTSNSFSTTIYNVLEGYQDGANGAAGNFVQPIDRRFIPDNMQAASSYFARHKYHNKLLFSTTDGTVNIGLKKERAIGGDWTLFDNFTLKYLGTGQDAFQLLVEDIAAKAKMPQLPAGVLATKGLIDAYNTAIGALKAANQTDIDAAIKTIVDERIKIDANLATWAALKEAYDKAVNLMADESMNTDELKAYCNATVKPMLDALTATTADVEAACAKLKELNQDVLNSIQPGTDVTDKYLVNANFNTAGKGWTIVQATNTGWNNLNYGGSDANKCFEAYNAKDFDVYQVVENPQVGVYEISVQGFYRYGRGDDAFNAYTNGTAPKDAVKVYVNNSNSVFKSVFDEKVTKGTLYTTEGVDQNNLPYEATDGNWYPNDMINGAIAFDNGMYKATSFGIVSEKGQTLRVGVKGSTTTNNWAIWDNFKIVYKGFDADVIKPNLKTVIDEAEALAGLTMGKAEADALAEALAEANTAYNGTDGKVMFASLNTLLDAVNAAGDSKEVFSLLTVGNTSLNTAIEASRATKATKVQAIALNGNITSFLTDNERSTEQAGKYFTTIAPMITDLKEAATVNVAVSELGYATFSSAEDVDFTDNAVAAYTAKLSADGTTLTLTKTDVLAAGQGAVLYAQGGAQDNVPAAAGRPLEADQASPLKANSTETTLPSEDTDYKYFYLYNGSKGVGFYLANNAGLAAGKAYLKLSKTSAAKTTFISIGDVVNAIATAESGSIDSNSPIFSTTGVRVEKPVRGLYIKNGKKIIVK